MYLSLSTKAAHRGTQRDGQHLAGAPPAPALHLSPCVHGGTSAHITRGSGKQDPEGVASCLVPLS